MARQEQHHHPLWLGAGSRQDEWRPSQSSDNHLLLLSLHVRALSCRSSGRIIPTVQVGPLWFPLVDIISTLLVDDTYRRTHSWKDYYCRKTCCVAFPLMNDLHRCQSGLTHDIIMYPSTGVPLPTLSAGHLAPSPVWSFSENIKPGRHDVNPKLRQGALMPNSSNNGSA